MRFNLDYNEFLDFICITLYDLLRDDKLLDNNDRFNALRKDLVSKGVKTVLFKYYLDAPGETRRDYRSRFKDMMKHGSMNTNTWFIFPYIEELIKEVAEIVTGREMNEEKVSKIINRLNGDE